MSLKDFQVDEETDDLGFRRPHRWLGKERESHYVPSWYELHRSLDAEVTHMGESQGMRVRDVLPFRRWALDANGETLGQAEFERKYLRYLDGLKNPETHNLTNEWIPNVRAFVRMKPDHNGNLVDWDFNDDGRVAKSERFTQDGDVAPEWLLAQQQKSQEAGGMRVLAQLVAEGKLTPEAFAAQATKIIGETNIITKSPEEIHAEVETQKAEATAAQKREAASKRAAHARAVLKQRQLEQQLKEQEQPPPGD